MSTQDIAQTFEGLFDAGSSAATAPMLALGVGVLLYLVCDLFDLLRPARPIVFLATIAASFVFELRILGMETPPGDVLLGSLRADSATALWGCLFLAGTLFAWVYSIGYYRENLPFKAEHDALMLTAPAGMMMMVGAGDLIAFFIGLELLSIPLYALAAFRRARMDSIEAGLKYFILGTFAAGFFLYGSALLYAETGAIALDALAASDLSSPMALTGLAFVSASLFFKISVFPFHLWVPDVYQGSPTPVAALMATGTKAAAFGFLIEAVGILPVGAAGTIAAIALITMLVGNLGALAQEDLKRMLAYSGIAHAGTMLLVIAGALALRAEGEAEAATGAMNAALIYMGAYVFTATGAFGVLALLESDGSRFTGLDSLRGLARSRPALASAMTLFMLSLGGIPATGGFLGKWFVFSVLVEAEMIGVAVLGVLLSVVALGYYLRVVVVLWMQPPPEGKAPPRTTRLSAGVATVCCSALVLLLGVLPGWYLDLLG
ncbi:MAG: NADH-quinone oxidoreductase subunit N [Planctomycetota bacterium]